MIRRRKYIFTLIAGCFVLCLLNSCVSRKSITYFNNIIRDSTAVIKANAIIGKINKNDILQITITSLDIQTSQIYNGGVNNSGGGNGSGSGNSSGSSVSATGGSGAMINGYLVDETGNIKLPLIGSIKAEGLSKDELADLITNKLASGKFAIDPIVTVRIINYKITVLGEVAHPGVIPVPNERITLPEALGMAGDLTAYASRDNLLLIRESDGKRIYKRFSLRNDHFFNTDIYNLQNQDIIYVEPVGAKTATADRTFQILPVALSVLSIAVIILVEVFKK